MKLIPKNILLGIAAAALSGTMVVSAILPNWQYTPSATEKPAAQSKITNVTGQVDPNLSRFFDASVVTPLSSSVPADREISVLLNLGTDTMLDEYDALGNTGITLGEFAASYQGKAVSARISRESKTLQGRIRNAGVSYTVGSTYDTLFGGFEVLIKAGEFDSLCKAVEGKAQVIVGEEYAPCETEIVTNDVAVDETTGIFDSSDSVYDGSGTVIAVLDTGLDYTHSAFSMANFTAPSEDDVITRATLAPQVASLRAAQFTPGLTAEKLYYNRKVPYTYDYADKDADVFPLNDAHGTHVAGIMVGKDDVIRGVAPNAQLAVMKVFSDREGGARTSWLLAALEDCVTLGVDVINMSLGSSSGFAREEIDEIATQQIYDSVKQRGISLVAAASNDYNSTFGSEKNGNLGLTSNPDSATVGAPSTYAAALSVASISGKKTPYFVHGEDIIYFTESSDRASEPKDFVKEILEPGETSKTFEYVLIEGVGQEADYMGLGDDPYSMLEGKIALVSRGITNFEDKARIAKKYGAAGCIIYNNVSGNISMTVGSVGDFPVCSVSRDDGQTLRAAEEKKITISTDQVAGPFMSDFSSWGPTPDLGIKPEITAHGGEIYSSVPGQSYDTYSGTSMASPNQAGFTALVRQYVKDNFPAEIANDPVAVTAAVNRLMMSTADIARNTNGLPFSVRKQGAGLANLKEATSTPAYIVTFDRKTGDPMDKTKLELGDDPEKRGVYELNFQIVNTSSDKLTYQVGAQVLTEGVAEQLTVRGDYTVDEKGHLLDGAQVSAEAVSDCTVSGLDVTIAGNATATVKVTITLSDKDKDYLNEYFKNGMYVEGYLTLTAKSGTEIDLNAPYLAFYGDWSQAPIFDLDIFETSKDELNDSLPTDEKTLPDAFASTAIGSLYEDYITYLGSYTYLQDPASTNKISAQREHIALTNQVGEYGGVNGISSFQLGMLRGAKRLLLTITDSVTGEVIFEKETYNQRKSYNGGGAIYPSFLDVDFYLADYDLKNNTRYDVVLTAYLDYDNDGAETNLRNVFSFPFYTDFEAPIITGVTYTSEYDSDAKKNRLYANVDIYDNHYVQGYVPGYITANPDLDAEYRYSLQSFGRYVVPFVGERNTTGTVQIELTDYLDDMLSLSYNGRAFLMQVMDYAGNTATYELEIPDKFVSIEFEDDTIEISPNQTYDLNPKITPAQDKSWKETIRYESSDEDIVRIVGGKLVGVSSGTATVTATSNSDPDVKTEVTVKVLFKGDPGYQELNKPVAEFFKLTGYTVNKVFYFLSSEDRDLGTDEAGDFVSFTGNSYRLEMFPSEQVRIEYNLKGYFDSEDYKVTFQSGNAYIASVTQDGTITARNLDTSGKSLDLERSTTITVNVLMRNANGEYRSTIYSQNIGITVKASYTTNGPYLMSYMGNGGVVEIPEEYGVTEISQYAFSNYRYIPKDLSAGDVIDKEDPYNSKIWYIGEDTITKVVVPEGVETIGPFAFANLTALEEMELPSTLTKIQTGAFFNCTKLQRLTFPKGNNLQFINQDAFTNCPIPEISLPKIVAIGDNAFMNTGLTSLHLYDTAQSIGANAFFGSRLSSVSIEAESVKLGAGAFGYCDYLGEITKINASVIPAGVFEGCSELGSVAIGKDVSVIEEYAFRGTRISSFELDPENETYTLGSDGSYLMEGTKLALVAPALAVFRPGSEDIETVGRGAFSACASISTVSLPSVTKVEDYAFAMCANLRTVTLGELESVGNYAFYGTPVTTAPRLAENATVGSYAFAGYRVPTATGFNVMAPRFTAFRSDASGVTIGADAFRENFYLTTLSLGDGATIGADAFYGALNLSSVTIGDDATIGAGAFRGMPASEVVGGLVPTGTLSSGGWTLMFDPYFSGISTLRIGDNAVIGDYAFCGAGSYVFDEEGMTNFGARLTNVTLGDNATIGDYAFAHCQYLTHIDLSGARSIGNYAFSGSLTSFYGVRYADTEEIGYVEYAPYFTAPSMQEVDLSACEKLGVGAFAFNDNLRNVTFNPALTELAAETFTGCTALQDIELGQFDSIGGAAFSGCTSLNNLYLKPGAAVGNSAFEGAEKLDTVEGLSAVRSIGSYAFAATALKSADLSGAERIGDFAFEDTKLEHVTFGDALADVGENPFVNCAISFEQEDGTDTYPIGTKGVQVIGGALYRPLPNGMEIVCYPNTKTDVTFAIAEGAIRVGAKAFYGAKLAVAELPHTVGAIGDRAFYGCNNLSAVVFKSYEAPILEEQYDPSVDTEDETGVPEYLRRLLGHYLVTYTNGDEETFGLDILGSRMWVADVTCTLFGANFVTEIGTEAGRELLANKFIIMVRPINGQHYDSFTFAQYFDATTDGPTAPRDETLEVIRLIDELPDPDDLTLEDEAAVVAARTAYNTLVVEQQALVSNFEELEAAERRINRLKEEQNKDPNPEEPEPVVIDPVVLGVSIGVAVAVAAALVALAIILLIRKNRKEDKARKEETADHKD